MKASEIVVGGVYTAKVSNNVVEVRVESINRIEGNKYRKAHTIYICTNLKTGRKVTIKSAAKFRQEVGSVNEIEDGHEPGALTDDNATRTFIPRRDAQTDGADIMRVEAEDEQSPDPTAEGERLRSTTPVRSVEQKPTEATSAQTTVPVPTIDPKATACDLVSQGFHIGQASLITPPTAGLASKIRENQNRHVAGSSGGKHLIVVARAGTGKTWTLTKGLGYVLGVQQDVLPSNQQAAIWDAMAESRGKIRGTATAMVCFNNPIAAELRTKVPQGCKAMTNHVMGSLSIRRTYKLVGGDDGSGVYENRVTDIVCDLFGRDRREMNQKYPGLIGVLKEIVGLCKQNLIGYDFQRKQWESALFSNYWDQKIYELCGHYGVDMEVESYDGSTSENFTDLCLEYVPKILDRCRDVNRDKTIDFNDMIWLPVVLDLPIFVNDLLMVDEAQDLNPCQQALVQRAGRRLILCGDPKQAIYGFAGADVDSLPNMETALGNSRLGVQTLPLNLTRRCGRAIVAEAQKIVPDFFAHGSNPEGKVSRARYEAPTGYSVQAESAQRTYHQDAEPGDMILCRVNAPLVSQCFKFLKEGRAANIQGRNVGKGITELIQNLQCDTVVDLIRKVDEWQSHEIDKENARKDPSESRIIAIVDKAECVRSFADASKTMNEVFEKIGSLFVDNETGLPKNCINLSSIHKSKGLEAERVFLLEPEGAKVPHPMAKSAWQQEQEWNLRYVAVTRAIKELVYVS